MKQITQQILPAGRPPTTVWGLNGAVKSDSKNGLLLHNAPSLTIEAKWNTPVRVKWINDLKDPVTGNYLPHLLPVDPTLHWANPPGGTLDPGAVPKYATPLLIPPVMPRAGVLKMRNGKNADYYEISMKQITQQILPAGLPARTVWGYGAVTASSKGALMIHNAPSLTIALAGRTRRSAAAAARFVGAGAPTADVVAAGARATIVLITVPDREIRGVCERSARGGGFRRGSLVAHASGAYTRELLDAAREAGAARAVLHPLQAVPSRERGVANIPGSYFRTEADRGARTRVSGLVRALGGRELPLPGWGGEPRSAALYHAGAVPASTYLVTLLDFAARLLRTLGADRRQALRAVLPLVRGTLANVEQFVAREGERVLMTVWATRDVKGFDALRKDYEAMSRRMTAMDASFVKGLADAMSKIEGFPVRTEWGEITSTVTKLEQRSTPESAFTVPAGYTKVQPPKRDLPEGEEEPGQEEEGQPEPQGGE